MRSILFFSAALLLFSALPRAFASEPCPGDERYVVILSMDGFRWDIPEKADVPTLDSIKKVGSYAETYPCFPANTFPNHYAMATGLHPDRHGIVNNTFYDRSCGRLFTISDKTAEDDPFFWHGEPIWNTVERQGLKANIFMWVGSETPVGDRMASVWTKFDSSVPFRQRADWVIEALHRPAEEIPNLIMWYFEEPDAIEHKHSTDSEETFAKVAEIDSVINYLMTNVRTSPVFDKINFIFTSDHGMATLSEERYVNVYDLLDNDRIEYAIPSTPLYIHPDEDYIDEAFEILSDVEHTTVYKRDEMPERFCYGGYTDRITSLVVLPETGWIADYREEDRPKTGGGHGFDPMDRDMHMVFYATGPAFKQGYIQESFQNLNIYALLCHLLGVEPAPNDGDISSVEGMLNY